MAKKRKWDWRNVRLGKLDLLALLIALVLGALALGILVLTGEESGFRGTTLKAVAGGIIAILIAILYRMIRSGGGSGVPRLKRIVGHNARPSDLERIRVKKLKEEIDEHPDAKIEGLIAHEAREAPAPPEGHYYTVANSIEIEITLPGESPPRTLVVPGPSYPPLPGEHYIDSVFLEITEMVSGQLGVEVQLWHGLSTGSLIISAPYNYQV